MHCKVYSICTVYIMHVYTYVLLIVLYYYNMEIKYTCTYIVSILGISIPVLCGMFMTLFIYVTLGGFSLAHIGMFIGKTIFKL